VLQKRWVCSSNVATLPAVAGVVGSRIAVARGRDRRRRGGVVGRRTAREKGEEQ
jgi:hypothetical protein